MTFDSAAAPIYEFLGLDVEIPEPGKAVGTMTVTRQHYSGVERMHGGLVFVVFDTVMGHAIHSVIDPAIDIATIEISQRFIRMVGVGPLRVEADVIHPGRKVVQVQGQAWESRGKLAATASGAFIVLGKKPVRPQNQRTGNG
ncbi:MAG: PaaI family thioesterase [Acidimicrobiia bacterium]|nr:PaaI family thioesterase [Acidimicrobiia bacterium]